MAPLTAFQLKVGVVETPVAELDGLERLGGGSSVVVWASVVKLLTEEYWPQVMVWVELLKA